MCSLALLLRWFFPNFLICRGRASLAVCLFCFVFLRRTTHITELMRTKNKKFWRVKRGERERRGRVCLEEGKGGISDGKWDVVGLVGWLITKEEQSSKSFQIIQYEDSTRPGRTFSFSFIFFCSSGLGYIYHDYMQRKRMQKHIKWGRDARERERERCCVRWRVF